jgi:hypothetical protein
MESSVFVTERSHFMKEKLFMSQSFENETNRSTDYVDLLYFFPSMSRSGSSFSAPNP